MTEIKTNAENKKNLSLMIAGIAVAMTAAFHFLVAEHPFGIGFAIFTVVLAAAMIVTAHLRSGKRNTWAYLFLIPVLLGAATHVLYASEVSRMLAFLLTMGSLVLFAYWYTRPKIEFKDVISFWPRRIWFETLWPYPALGEHLRQFKGDKRMGSIVMGIAISIPFLLIFLALFTSADQLFAKSFSNVFETEEMAELAAKLFRDLIVGLFFLASGFLMLTRLSKSAEDKLIQTWNWVNQTALNSFLVMLNILFAVFVAFQAAYFFGGEMLVKAQGLTYSEYAVSGFFELLFASGLVFGITWFIYRATNMKNKFTGILSISLICFTGVIITSAMSRLWLYVDAYGLTLSRFWAAYCIILIGLVLLTVAIGIIIKYEYSKLAKLVFLGSVILTSVILVFNTEAFIASYNIQRYERDNSLGLDTRYLVYNLSADALTPMAEFWRVEKWNDEIIWDVNSMQGFNDKISSNELNVILEREREKIGDTFKNNWFSTSASEYKAYFHLGEL